MIAKGANLPDSAIVRGEARDLDHDRYLAALLAPAPARDALMTVAAFHGEIARIPTNVREPAMGAIRLQWWRDALGGDAAAEPTGSPVVDRLRHDIDSGALPLAEVLSIIDAYETLLQPGALAEAAAIDGFLEESQGAAFRLSARILGVEDGEAREIVGVAAQAYGPTGASSCCGRCRYCGPRGTIHSRGSPSRIGLRSCNRSWPPRAKASASCAA
jgi:15-cis-phytoene synthase